MLDEKLLPLPILNKSLLNNEKTVFVPFAVVKSCFL